MKNQVLIVLCGISFFATSPVFGMQHDSTEEQSKSTMTRQLFKVGDPTASHLEMFSDDLKIQVATYISPQGCLSMQRVCKRWNNALFPHQVSFLLETTLCDSLHGSCLLRDTSDQTTLSLRNINFSLCYFQNISGAEAISFENPLLLCSYKAPENFTENSQYFLGKQRVSYFKFHGTPNAFFLDGIPEGWHGNGRDESCSLFRVGCNMGVNLASLHGKTLKLSLSGYFVLNNHPSSNHLFSCSLANPYYVPTREDHIAALRLGVIEMHKAQIPLESIHQLCSNITMRDIKEILGIKEETREEGFARLRPQILQLKDAAISNAEIANRLSIPEDLIEEILNNKPDNQ